MLFTKNITKIKHIITVRTAFYIILKKIDALIFFSDSSSCVAKNGNKILRFYFILYNLSATSCHWPKKFLAYTKYLNN